MSHIQFDSCIKYKQYPPLYWILNSRVIWTLFIEQKKWRGWGTILTVTIDLSIRTEFPGMNYEDPKFIWRLFKAKMNLYGDKVPTSYFHELRWFFHQNWYMSFFKSIWFIHMFNNISLLIKEYCVSLKSSLKCVDALTGVKVKRVTTLILNWTFTSFYKE